MRSMQCAWWGVCLALLLVLPSDARPNPDSETDSESWRPIAPIHRVSRYSTGRVTNVDNHRPDRPSSLIFKQCMQQLNYLIRSKIKKVYCANYTLDRIRSGNISEYLKGMLNFIASRPPNDTLRVLLDGDNNRARRDKNTSAASHKEPLGEFKDQPSLLGRSENGSDGHWPTFKTGASKQRRRRRAARISRRLSIKPSIAKQDVPDDEDIEWLPVSLSPPDRGDVLDTKSNGISNDLVHNFVSNSLPDLKIPQENTGTLVQVVSSSPELSKEPSDSKWESVSLDDLILSHTTEPVHHHKPATWHKRPTVILVQDTPQELLPKPPSYHTNHYHHVDPKPVHHLQTPSPEPFPRPTYHYPRPSPEPPPKPSYHYPIAEPEPSPKPVYHYKPSTYKPIYHHYYKPQPHFPYTTVIVQTSSSSDPDPEPEPSPEPPWLSHYPDPEPEPEPEPELEDPDPDEPETIVAGNDPVPEPPSQDIPTYDDQPSRPTPPPIFIMASPISPGSPTNPVTISSGKPPPSIVILASPEDSPPGSPPLADPIYPGGAGGGGGGLVPLVPIVPPPIVPGAAGLGGAAGSGGGGGSDCPAVQFFNVQTITNSVENKDCVINLNAPIHNTNGGDDQIEVPDVQADVPLDDIPDSSTVATTTKKPSTGSMSVLEYLSSFFASMTIFNPISISFWSFLFAPVSILLASGLAVGALILPWLFPSYWFGRRMDEDNRRVDYDSSPYRLRESVLRFERNLKSGMNMDDFLQNIGLLRG